MEARADFLDATTAIAASTQVSLLDLDPVVSTDKRTLMSDTFHFSDTGAEVVARAVAGELRLEDALRDGTR
jgi:lysophospholipase L1-like esterase